MTAATASSTDGPWLAALHPRRVLLAAIVVGAVVSTQMLGQPFVWRHWPVTEILAAWVSVLGERVGVAVAVGIALSLAILWSRRHPGLRRPAELGVAAGAAAATAKGARLCAAADVYALLDQVPEVEPFS